MRPKDAPATVSFQPLGAFPNALGVAEGLGLGSQAAAVLTLIGEMLYLRVAHVPRVVGFGAAVVTHTGRGGFEGTAEVSARRRHRAAGRTD